MQEFVRERPGVVRLLGLVVAGVVAAVTASAGASSPYAVVLGLAVGSPAMNVGGPGSDFDREAYLNDRGTRKTAIDLGLAGVVGLLFGAAAVSTGVYAGVGAVWLLMVIGGGVTALASTSTFIYQTLRYRDFDPGTDDGDGDDGDDEDDGDDGGAESDPGPESDDDQDGADGAPGE